MRQLFRGFSKYINAPSEASYKLEEALSVTNNDLTLGDFRNIYLTRFGYPDDYVDVSEAYVSVSQLSMDVRVRVDFLQKSFDSVSYGLAKAQHQIALQQHNIAMVQARMAQAAKTGVGISEPIAPSGPSRRNFTVSKQAHHEVEFFYWEAFCDKVYASDYYVSQTLIEKELYIAIALHKLENNTIIKSLPPKIDLPIQGLIETNVCEDAITSVKKEIGENVHNPICRIINRNNVERTEPKLHKVFAVKRTAFPNIPILRGITTRCSIYAASEQCIRVG